MLQCCRASATRAPAFRSLASISQITSSISPLNQLTSSNSSPNLISMQVRHRSNRSRRGLYDGADKRFGNNVSFSKRRTRRSFEPNVFTKCLYSEVLEEMVRFKVTAKALRSIDKIGGLDNYLFKSKHVTEGSGVRVRKRIEMRQSLDKKFGRENVTLTNKIPNMRGYGSPGYHHAPW